MGWPDTCILSRLSPAGTLLLVTCWPLDKYILRDWCIYAVASISDSAASELQPSALLLCKACVSQSLSTCVIVQMMRLK